MLRFIDKTPPSNRTVLLRVDFNVPFNPDHTIANEERITSSLPTISTLLQHHNKLIIIAHLGEPTKREKKYSLSPIAKRLQHYLPHKKIILVDDFLTDKKIFKNQTEKEIILLENIRFYPGETTNDPEFTKQLACLGQVYVNDAFGVCHRKQASVIGLPSLLPSFGGLLLKKEITILESIIKYPHKPFVAIIGGKKIATKIQFLKQLLTTADSVLLGGGIANTFLAAQGYHIGKSLVSITDISLAKKLLILAKQYQTEILLPHDMIVARKKIATESSVKKTHEITDHDHIFDIGPETQADFGNVIAQARTIIWNGPVGYIENPLFKRGTDFLYYAITQNELATSVVGGGDTLAALDKKEYLDKITHVSTGGGAMLELIANGTLPGIEAIKKIPHK
jgi:phosphoglycerate kinase